MSVCFACVINILKMLKQTGESYVNRMQDN